MKKYQGLLIFTLCLFFISADATPCLKEKNFIFQGNDVYFLNKQTSGQFYFEIINMTNQLIYLNKVIAHPSASAGWASELAGQHYSILAVKSNSFLLSCGKTTTQGFEVLNCRKFLSICQLVSPPLQNGEKAIEGSYWLIENDVYPIKKLENS